MDLRTNSERILIMYEIYFFYQSAIIKLAEMELTRNMVIKGSHSHVQNKIPLPHFAKTCQNLHQLTFVSITPF